NYQYRPRFHTETRRARNLTIHEYFRINLEIIWDIVENDIPPLEGQIEAILQEFI
ncbi:HepT-like ribonuclease domain-containing protein, partial [Microcystis aeruginosa]|uniref:HepT-like ribonuclease domain-containing protein n=1 Tax=Microcystis aeruginosa TaxID=1126 RepID=UPI0012B63BF3